MGDLREHLHIYGLMVVDVTVADGKYEVAALESAVVCNQSKQESISSHTDWQFADRIYAPHIYLQVEKILLEIELE